MRITHEMECTPMSFDATIREKPEDASTRILQLDEIVYRCFYVYKTLNLCSHEWSTYVVTHTRSLILFDVTPVNENELK